MYIKQGQFHVLQCASHSANCCRDKLWVVLSSGFKLMYSTLSVIFGSKGCHICLALTSLYQLVENWQASHFQVVSIKSCDDYCIQYCIWSTFAETCNSIYRLNHCHSADMIMSTENNFILSHLKALSLNIYMY